ncbi:alpha/beta hydrolase [Dysosmobacter sp. NSJ-60]|uniref:Alpha/beta hydrolase n=1 Tax=Pusillibacter faecalis TaxID=2714358 RepID=A0A810QB25_9FIRM|nr:alpha/beta hydrolase [Pusillibacter faecalis]MBC5747962.1 alpha/beta hydrolase [Dysosmobacter hominis]BCK85488.1 alpha/beta hydrolase [Pusillibacter faecalis]
MTEQTVEKRCPFEEEYVFANGIEHYLLHYPKAPGTPVLLYLHGGPGSVESLFAYQLDSAWGEMFTHVHWDQRGAGKTLRRNGRRDRPESMEQMLADLHGVIGHLRRKYQTERVVLLGHSWGSVLGSLYVLRHPETVLAYIGVGQVVGMMENERTAYRETLEMARRAGNEAHVRALEQMGDYPPNDPERLLKLLPRMRRIQAAYDDGPASGTGLGELLNSMRRSPVFRWSDLLSFTQIMKVNRPLHLQMLSFRLGDFAPRYAAPIHYLLGEADPIAPTSLSRAYFETIEAPVKGFTVIPGTGHNPAHERPGEFAAALRTIRETL